MLATLNSLLMASGFNGSADRITDIDGIRPVARPNQATSRICIVRAKQGGVWRDIP